MNEAQTKNDLITPALVEAGWGIVEGSSLRLEFAINKEHLIGSSKRLLKAAQLAPPTFESDRIGNQFTAHLLLHHFLSEDDLNWLKGFESYQLNDEQKQALILVRELGAINNFSYRQISDVDTPSATRDLRQLCDFRLLLKKGDKKGTYYLAGEMLNDEPLALNDEPIVLNDEPSALNDEPPMDIKTSNTDKNKLVLELPIDLRNQVLNLKKRESNKEKISSIILSLCRLRPYRLSELALLLNKGDNYISNEYIKPLLGVSLDYKYPEVINHPNQAYLTIN